MAVFGPFTLTAGQVLKCTVTTDPTRLRFLNTSRFDLAIAFTQAPPPAYISGEQEYLYMVPSGDRVTVDIPFDRYGSFGFPGYVYVFPIDNTALYALTGTTSGNTSFVIETYLGPQTPPSDFASPQRQDISSQSRPVSLVPALNNGGFLGNMLWFSNFTPASAGNSALMINLGNPNDSNVNDVWWVFVYGISLYPQANTTIGETEFHLQVECKNGGGTTIFTSQFAHGRIITPANAAPTYWRMPDILPRAIGFSPLNVASVNLTFLTDGVAGTAIGSINGEYLAYMRNLGVGAIVPNPIGFASGYGTQLF